MQVPKHARRRLRCDVDLDVGEEGEVEDGEGHVAQKRRAHTAVNVFDASPHDIADHLRHLLLFLPRKGCL